MAPNRGRTVSAYMIKSISFDFYNTLVQFWPPLDEIQQAACRELGLNVSKSSILHGYSVADGYFNEENGRWSLASRSANERSEFFAKYEQMILENAGLPVSLQLAGQVWEMAMTIPKDFVPFDDTIPTLAALQGEGYRLGVLTNLRRDIGDLCRRLGLAPFLDFCINAEEAGAEKPHAPIFLAALERASVDADEAVYVGDQFESDILGARAVGMYGVLIDRGGWQAKVEDCPRIASLSELSTLMAGAPDSLIINHHKS